MMSFSSSGGKVLVTLLCQIGFRVLSTGTSENVYSVLQRGRPLSGGSLETRKWLFLNWKYQKNPNTGKTLFFFAVKRSLIGSKKAKEESKIVKRFLVSEGVHFGATLSPNEFLKKRRSFDKTVDLFHR